MPFSTNLFNYKPIYQGEAVKEYDDYITEAVKTYDTAQNNATLLNKTLASFKAKALPGQQQYIDEVMKTVNGSLEKIATDVHGGKRWEGALSQVNDLAATLAGDPHLEVISESYKNYVAAKAVEQTQTTAGHESFWIGDNPETFNSLDKPFQAVVTPKGDWLNTIEDEARLVAPQIVSEIDVAQSKPGYIVFKTTAGNARLRNLKAELKGNFKLSSEYNNLKKIYDQTGKSDQIEKDIDAMIDNKVNLMVYENVKLDLDKTGSGSSKTAAEGKLPISPVIRKMGLGNVKEDEKYVKDDDFKYSSENKQITGGIKSGNAGMFYQPDSNTASRVEDPKKSIGWKKSESLINTIADGELKTKLKENLNKGNYKYVIEKVNEIRNKERASMERQIDFSTSVINGSGLKEIVQSQFVSNVGTVEGEEVKGDFVQALSKKYSEKSGLNEKDSFSKMSESLKDLTVSGIDLTTGDIVGSIKGVKFSVPASMEVKDTVRNYASAISDIKKAEIGTGGVINFILPILGTQIPIEATFSKMLDSNGEIEIKIYPNANKLSPAQISVLRDMGIQRMSGNDLLNLVGHAVSETEFMKNLKQEK